jgi:Disulphide bond corrector protein DsbC
LKNIFLSILVVLITVAAKAQLNPVSWTYSAKKVSDKIYELHITATMQSGWHLYSQTQPEDAIAEPTKITFNKNPLLILDGKIKEEGKMEKFHDAKLELSANQYSSKVEFVQTIKLKANAKTNVSGTVRFQTCNDEKCLPPKSVTFTIAL